MGNVFILLVLQDFDIGLILEPWRLNWHDVESQQINKNGSLNPMMISANERFD